MRNIKRFILIFSILFTGCATTQPEITKIGAQNYRIIGKLHKNEYDQIIKIVKENKGKPLSFHVTSIGGTSVDLIEAMDAVYEHHMVHWYVVDKCDSACAIMALATKHAHGEVRLHSFYSYHHHEVHPAPDFNAVILNKLYVYGYNTKELHHMFDSVEKLWTIKIIDGNIVK